MIVSKLDDCTFFRNTRLDLQGVVRLLRQPIQCGFELLTSRLQPGVIGFS